MRTPSVVQLASSILLLAALGACAASGDARTRDDPALPADDPEIVTPAPEPDDAAASRPPMATSPTDPKAFGGHVTLTEIVPPTGMPMSEGDGVLRFDAFGPAPGTSPEQFAAWTALVHERFLGDPTPERQLELDGQLVDVPVIAATPAFINSLSGLDMADPDDIIRAGAITQWWYLAQIRYKQVVLDANPAALLPIHVRNRMLVVDAWVRMWKRTLKQEDGVVRLSAHVEQLIADREAARDQQRREYEEKLRRRAEEKADADAEDAAESAGEQPY